MRWIRVVLAGAAALGLAGLEGCGGKVVIDAESVGGAGGAGGGGSSSTGGAGGSSSSSSGSSTCSEGTCSGTPDGSCDCSGACSAGQTVQMTCFSTSGSFACSCSVDGEVKGKCEATTMFACDVKAGCCFTEGYFP